MGSEASIVSIGMKWLVRISPYKLLPCWLPRDLPLASGDSFMVYVVQDKLTLGGSFSETRISRARSRSAAPIFPKILSTCQLTVQTNLFSSEPDASFHLISNLVQSHVVDAPLQAVVADPFCISIIFEYHPCQNIWMPVHATKAEIWTSLGQTHFSLKWIDFWTPQIRMEEITGKVELAPVLLVCDP